MAHRDDIALMAHLMRRAGFGAGRDELEARVAKGYDATVEELLHPETQPPVDPYTLLRYQPSALLPGGVPPMGNVNYMYYLVTTQRPLEEKMALFWHQVIHVIDITHRWHAAWQQRRRLTITIRCSSRSTFSANRPSATIAIC